MCQLLSACNCVFLMQLLPWFIDFGYLHWLGFFKCHLYFFFLSAIWSLIGWLLILVPPCEFFQTLKAFLVSFIYLFLSAFCSLTG